MSPTKQALESPASRRFPTFADLCLLLVVLLVLALSWHGLPEDGAHGDLERAARTAISGHVDAPAPREGDASR